ncbi:MAG: Bug family tripartite tricarboxylate transporter substrate binding protein [Beijerinckiaceae bacterium]
MTVALIVRVAGIAMLASLNLARAETPKGGGFAPGSQLSIGVASTPGGGYDRYARLLAQHISRHIPGRPTVLVKNMTGAGGSVLVRYITHAVPRDGSWIALVLPSTVTAGLYQDKAKLKYDPSKLIHIGSANSEVDMCFVRADAGLKKLEDARNKSVNLGATAAGSATFEQPNVLNSLVGTKFNIVAGYPGTRQIVLALERGEVAGVCGMSYSGMRLQRAQWLESGFLLPISQNNVKGDPVMTARGVQRAPDLVSDPDVKRTLALIYSQQSFGRPFVAAEGTPPERVRILRAAFDATMRDPELQADARKMKLDINPVSGAELQTLVTGLYATPTAIVHRAMQALRGAP